jgi:hypothetical protein
MYSDGVDVVRVKALRDTKTPMNSHHWRIKYMAGFSFASIMVDKEVQFVVANEFVLLSITKQFHQLRIFSGVCDIPFLNRLL